MTHAASADGPFAGRDFNLSTLIERATQDFRGGRLVEADALYAEIVGPRPDYPDGWFLYGLSALEAGRVETAIEWLGRAASMRRAEPRYRVALVRACLAAGRTDDALVALEAATRVAPDAPDINAALGRAYLTLGQADKATAVRAKLWARRCTGSPGGSTTAGASGYRAARGLRPAHALRRAVAGCAALRARSPRSGLRTCAR